MLRCSVVQWVQPFGWWQSQRICFNGNSVPTCYCHAGYCVHQQHQSWDQDALVAMVLVHCHSLPRNKHAHHRSTGNTRVSVMGTCDGHAPETLAAVTPPGDTQHPVNLPPPPLLLCSRNGRCVARRLCAGSTMWGQIRHTLRDYGTAMHGTYLCSKEPLLWLAIVSLLCR